MCRRVICRAAIDVLAASLGRSPRLADDALNLHGAVLGELLHAVEHCRLGHCDNLFGVLLPTLHYDPA